MLTGSAYPMEPGYGTHLPFLDVKVGLTLHHPYRSPLPCRPMPVHLLVDIPKAQPVHPIGHHSIPPSLLAHQVEVVKLAIVVLVVFRDLGAGVWCFIVSLDPSIPGWKSIYVTLRVVSLAHQIRFGPCPTKSYERCYITVGSGAGQACPRTIVRGLRSPGRPGDRLARCG